MEQKHIVLAGAGMMGASLSQVYAQAGYQVSLWNGSESGLERAKNLIALNQETLRKEGMVTAEQSEELQKRITYTTSKVCMEDCDLMVEAIIENMDAKHKFWEDASRIAPEDALLATNTSGLLITEVAKSVYHPERFMGQHWLNPPHLLPLCEIIRGEKTEEAYLQQMYELVKGLGKKPVIVSPDIRTGLTMGVPDPHAVGKDRLVDAAYAAANFPLPVVTVDLGTATTFNVVDENKVFRGGVICPGLSTGLRALGERCAQLPQVHLSSPKSAIGVDTEKCMLSGSVLGTAVLLDGITQRIEEELGRPATLVVTGGLAKYVIPLCRHPLTYDPELLLKGLALLYQLNAPQHERYHEPRSDGEHRRPRPAGRRPYNNGSSPRRRNNRRPRRDDEAKAG